MRVLVDATAIPADRGGVGRYVDAIVATLAGRDDVDLAVACQARDLAAFSGLGAKTVVALPAKLSSIPRRLVWEQFGLPGLARRVGAELVYSPHYTFPVLLPLVSRARRVVTVWDLTFFTHPEVHSRLKRTFFRGWIRLGRLLRTTVTTASDATARELERVVGTPSNRVIVTPLAYDAAVFHVPAPAELAALLASLTPPAARWIAFLGTLEPRKNVPALIEAYRTAVAGRTDAPALLLAGAPGWDDAVSPAVEAARRDGFDVRALGYLPIEQLSAFLGGAELVAYPSLGEGFGLPVLEAMASGATVLTTRRLSLPEVGGDAVAYSEPDAAALATAIGGLLDDPARREALARAAVDRASGFTWSATAAALVRAFETALA